ncbi:MAG: alanine/ornithine racemase family PLP-dependent enzyme [Bacteroidetes bacterium]|nr:MAG: alanine/ornithine racemase family PLP-dependent enzyme [Bacteroidota bacterium]
MSTPRLEINLKKIAHNAKTLNRLYGSKGIDVIGVTKAVCGDPHVASALVSSGISILADSRLINIRRMRKAGIKAEFLLLRTPFMSQAEAVVKYADISLNSEISVIKKLSKYAERNHTKHKIILMVELGDLREGIMPADLDNTIKQVLELKSIELVGIGANLACFGGIKPDDEKMNYLSSIAEDIEKKYDLKLKFVSGGNSANYTWFKSTIDTGKINNLRLGESIYLGCETLHRKAIPKLYTDAFTLVAEVIESKLKPSLPYGEVAQDAFGNIPSFNDIGKINRTILGIGLQDVTVSGLTPKSDIEIIGASSDHIIVDAKNTELKVGEKVEFDLNYAALLSAMTSPYILKKVELSLWTHKNIAKVLNKNTANIKKIFQTSLL